MLGGLGASGAGLSAETLKAGAVERETKVRLLQYAFAGFALALLSLARMKELPLRGAAVEAAREAAAE